MAGPEAGSGDRPMRSRPHDEARWAVSPGLFFSAIGVTFVLVAAGCTVPEPLPISVEKPKGPLTLETAVDLAFKNNPDLNAAQQRVDEASAAITNAAYDLGPVIQFVESFTAVDKPSQAFGYLLDQRRFNAVMGAGGIQDPGITSDWRTGFGGSITIYDGGRRLARLRGRIAEAGSVVARAEQVRRDLALQVARAFYGIHKARETAAAQEKSIDTLTTHLRITEARQSEGAARRSDVLAVRVRLAETREAAIVARNSAERALAGLRILLGLDIDDYLELAPATGLEPYPRENLASLLEKARRYRFEILEADARVEAARMRVHEALAGYQPEITLFGTFGFDDEDPFSFKYGNWTWGAAFLWSLMDILRTPARVREAAAGLATENALRRKVMLEVQLDVKNSLLDGEEADARHDVAAQAVALAEESLRLVEAEYKEGAATITRLLEAELALTQARTRLSATTYDRALSRIAISHAVGEYPTPPAQIPVKLEDGIFPPGGPSPDGTGQPGTAS